MTYMGSRRTRLYERVSVCAGENASFVMMRTPYVPHFFGEAAWARAALKHGWLIAAVATSIPWPQEDVLVVYDGTEYLLMGAMRDNKPVSPCIATPCPRQDYDAALAQVLRFVSVLGWFKRGYVDVAGFVWGTRPHRYGHARLSYADVLQGGQYAFDCNYMPVIANELVRRALAFWREGRRLREVHDAYAFLSFFKVIESPFAAKQRVSWVEANLPALEGDAAKRVAELQTQGVNVNKHIYDSGRCAVAHAGLGGEIVDPDIPSDRRRIRDDMVVVEALAKRFIGIDAGVPDEMDVYRTRDRLEPWHALLTPEGLSRLSAGQPAQYREQLGQLADAKISVRLWPEEPTPDFVGMTLDPVDSGPGWVKFAAVNQRNTMLLVFAMDVAKGRMHTVVDEWALAGADPALTEGEVEAFTYMAHRVIGNGRVELIIDGTDPVPCEIVIPVNIMPRPAKQAAAEAVEQFRRQRGGGQVGA